MDSCLNSIIAGHKPYDYTVELNITYLVKFRTFFGHYHFPRRYLSLKQEVKKTKENPGMLR